MFDLEKLKKNELKGDQQDDEQVEEEEVPINENGTEPIVKVQPFESKTLEEDEIVVFSTRCKLYRYDKNADPPAYKERGVGILKFLRHKENNKVRIVMRREKTLKLCANHYLLKSMKLGKNKATQFSLIWTAISDFADEVAKNETFACRFKNSEDMEGFRKAFEQCVDELNQENEEDTLEKSLKEVKIDSGDQALEKQTEKETQESREDIRKETGSEDDK
ncbi:Ran-specific GTPase-activating protein [Thelohanellus kitauei]|uniref:Ran-specific GTPase-activating protein n=1 Tax=Thelohanellus kitauei TaxID=669202 RepID=A0A0C2N031_THEKT|nr:Ran-specific GTPase-activating protein [Thelohanellus kitauei]